MILVNSDSLVMEFSNGLITSYTKYPMFNSLKVQLSEQIPSNWAVDTFSYLPVPK